MHYLIVNSSIIFSIGLAIGIVGIIYFWANLTASPIQIPEGLVYTSLIGGSLMAIGVALKNIG